MCKKKYFSTLFSWKLITEYTVEKKPLLVEIKHKKIYIKDGNVSEIKLVLEVICKACAFNARYRELYRKKRKRFQLLPFRSTLAHASNRVARIFDAYCRTLS